MLDRSPFPWTGFALAAISCVVLLFADFRPLEVIAVLILWTCSLWLTASRPPDTPGNHENGNFSPDTMGELIEHSATPLLVLEANKVAIANLAARRLLGAHVVGQDPRVAFRQPEAIKLLNSGRNGAAIVRGLARRRDIWRMSRQQLDDKMSVIELSNRTAEADISRAHTDFVANASHELRTPLSSIIGYVDTLREDGEDVDPALANKFLNTIAREARRLQNLVNDLMSLSRVEAEKHDQPDEEIELAPLVERAARDAAGAERQARLDLSGIAPATIHGDPQQLEQLVRNLVDNALKYGSDDGSVTVSLDHADSEFARLSITDRGEGIPKEHLPHLTRRFYRTDPGRSRASGGTGLGLAIVKHIVERHRGRMDIESVVGEGTTIRVRFPAAKSDNSEG